MQEHVRDGVAREIKSPQARELLINLALMEKSVREAMFATIKALVPKGAEFERKENSECI